MKKIQSIVMNQWFWLVAVIVFCVSRVATWAFPFDSDHWIFYYLGRRWAQGATLYLDMWDHKSPLIYGYNAFLFKAFGGNIVLQRIFFTLFALVGLWLFYKTAKLLFNYLQVNNPLYTARVTTLLFAFFANLSQFTNSGNNNENLGWVLLMGALYCYLRYRKGPVRNEMWLLASGIATGFVFILKANFAFLLLPLLIDLIIVLRKNFYKLIAGLAIFAFGTLAQLLIWSLYFVHLHTYKLFLTATFTFNSKYIRALGWDIHQPGITIFLGILLLLMMFFAPFLIKAWSRFRQPDSKLGIFVPMLAASAIIFMISAGTFYSNYFLVAIPYLCLVAGATATSVFKYRGNLTLFILVVIAALMFAISLKQVYNTFYGSDAANARDMTAAANYIKDHTSSNDTIFANVYGATFYRLADRNSGSRFVSASHPLIDYKYHFDYNFNLDFITDMEESQAKYVVESSDPSDIYRTENPVMMRYINHNYTLQTTIGRFDILARTTN